MQIIRTIIWVVVFIVILLFAINNWRPLEVKIWEGLILETKIPALAISCFLLGLIPMWLIHRGTKWRLKRRISTLESAARSAAGTESVQTALTESGSADLPPDSGAHSISEDSSDERPNQENV